ncbi:GDSL-type esterase/lipase family protein [Porphyromonas somerae]|uniref:GDSL-type esterase/lipase family protein n=1 Tax=Porphyromonas somerae TaxID=322095 RepID=UPI001FCB6CBE|nr:GDSL-type esterase/lipase family protein [Porphyromonas somerae]BDE81072.1 sialate O-acetylesterase [Porphyromonas somerae]
MKTINHLLLILTLCSLSTVALAQSGDYRGSTYYHQRESLFRTLPVQNGAVVFLGNSITDGGEWGELFPDQKVLNRGISGDVTLGVLHRLDEVIRHQPSKVFLLIGINDLARGRSKDEICHNIFQIVREIQQQSPATQIYVQSILPINDQYDRFKALVNMGDEIIRINNELEQHAAEGGYTYIDLHSEMTDGAGRLRDDFANDGLHLMGVAYQHWADILRKLL